MTLDEISKHLETRGKTLLLAVGDLRALLLCGDAAEAVGWVDHRKDPEITVYVLSSGVLHTITGRLDPVLNQYKPNDALSTECSYSAAPIGRPARWSVNLKRTARVNDGETITRNWTFRLGREKVLEIEYQNGQQPDPTSFAEGLAGAILDQAEVSTEPGVGHRSSGHCL
jgi:hypothetical protein